MDEMNKNMESDEALNSSSEKKEENIQIWKKTTTSKKTRFVYESVPPKMETADQAEQVQNENVQQTAQNTKMADEGNTQQQRAEIDDNEKKQEENQAKKGKADAVKVPEEKKERTVKQGFFKKPRKAEKTARPKNKKVKTNNVLQKDNVSKKVRQEYWKQQIVEGTLGENGPIVRLVKTIRRYSKQILVIAVIAALVLGGSYLFNRYYTYQEYDVVWQIPATENEYTSYLTFGEVILSYSQDGVSCIGQDGKILWSQTFNMDVPEIVTRGSYAAIYDVKGNSIYIFDAEGVIGNIETIKDILKADISAAGVVAVVLDDTTSNYINYYDRRGNQLEVEVKTLISGDGYPVDIAISPDGNQLMTSYIYASGGSMLNQVVFRNFEVGKNNVDRVVGGFKQYEDDLVPEVVYFDNQNSVAVSETYLDFYSTRNAAKPEIAKTVNLDARIKSVFYNEEYFGLILEEDAIDDGEDALKETAKAEVIEEEESEETESTSKKYPMIVFDKNGNQVFKSSVEFEYEYVQFSGDGIVMYNKSVCVTYNMTGVCKFKKTLDMDIQGVIRFAEDELVVHGNGALQKLQLK